MGHQLWHRLYVIILLLLGVTMLNGDVWAGEYPNSEQCTRVKGVKPPQTDMPSKQLAASLTDCDPQDLYYSQKGNQHSSEADWDKVRACAFAKNDDAVLMMLYANGFGVKQNPDLAVRYACTAESAPAEMEFRIERLVKISKDGSEKGKIFDQCDEVTSGYMMGHCAQLDEQQGDKDVNKRLGDISSHLNPAQKAAFEKLRSAAFAFAEARGHHETAEMGSMRGSVATQIREDEKNQFLSDLEQIEKGMVPSDTQDQFTALDEQLNQAYQSVMHAPTTGENEGLNDGEVTKKDVRETQRVWLKYRDAWVAFGQARYPSVAPYSWRALLTQRRIKELKELLTEPEE